MPRTPRSPAFHRTLAFCALLFAVASSHIRGACAREPLNAGYRETIQGQALAMIVRFLARVFTLLGSAAGMAQVIDSQSPPRHETRESQTQRVRELIYFFRTYRVFCRDEEWAQTIRELATIGKAAVPELVAELDRTDRDATIRSLAFSLRAIGDPRAVPALIRSIPKALRPPGSDCGVQIINPELRKFMKAHQNHPDNDASSVLCGRPVNEILSALERITKHREPPDIGKDDPLRGVFRGGDPQQQRLQWTLFHQRQRLWEAWWSQHWDEFVTREELQSVELPKRDRDLVERAGIARYGPLFPTGPDVRLGPVHMLRLCWQDYLNGKSQLDFDTGRVFRWHEGMRAIDWGPPADWGSRGITWYRQNGVDVHCPSHLEGIDLMLWLIDDRRWETIEEEVRKPGPLPVGREATGTMMRFEEDWTEFKPDRLATFLFTTREGGRGIVQVFRQDEDADRHRVRYRMWPTAHAGRAVRPLVAEARKGTSFGSTVTTTLQPVAEGRECLLDLETGHNAIPPEFLTYDISNVSSLPRNGRFTRWCRVQGIDVVGQVEKIGRGAARPVGAEDPGPQTRYQLIGLDMVAVRILPGSFDEMTIEEGREIVERMPRQEPRTAWMAVEPNRRERPDSFAFMTREGTLGLLQVEADKKEPGRLTIRYRLEGKK